MTRADIIANVASRLKIKADIVQECHDQYWHKIVKEDVSKPQFDNYELPYLGVWKITKFTMRKTLKKEISKLRATKNKLKGKPDSIKYKNQVEFYKERVHYLWKLKNEIF